MTCSRRRRPSPRAWDDLASNGNGVAALDRAQKLQVDAAGVVEDLRPEEAAQALGGEGHGHPTRGDGVGGAEALLGQFGVVVDVLAVQDAAVLELVDGVLGHGSW